MAGMQQPPMAITFPSCWLVIYAPSDLPCLLVLQWQGGVFGCWKTQGGQPSTTYRPYSFFSTLVWDHVQWDGFCLSLLKLYIEKSWNLEQLDIYIYIIIYIYYEILNFENGKGNCSGKKTQSTNPGLPIAPLDALTEVDGHVWGLECETSIWIGQCARVLPWKHMT